MTIKFDNFQKLLYLETVIGDSRKIGLIGIFTYLAGMFSCALLNVFMTEMLIDFNLPVLQVIFVRQVFVVLLLFPYIIKYRTCFFDKTTFKRNAIRNFILSIATFLIYVGMSRVALNEAIAITFLTPIISSFLAVKLLKETAPKMIKPAFLLAMIGVYVVKKPDFIGTQAYIGYGALLLYACTRSYVVILDKRLTATLQPIVMLSYSSIFMLVFSGCSFALFKPIPLEAYKYIAMSGLLFCAEYYCIFSAYKRCQAITLQPIDFSKLLFTMILSSIFLGQHVNAHQVIGGSIIICGYGLIILEKRLRHKA